MGDTRPASLAQPTHTVAIGMYDITDVDDPIGMDVSGCGSACRGRSTRTAVRPEGRTSLGGDDTPHPWRHRRPRPQCQ